MPGALCLVLAPGATRRTLHTSKQWAPVGDDEGGNTR